MLQDFLKTLLIAATLFHVSAAFSTVYKTTDEDGNIVFSDSKSKDAERIYLPPLPVYKAVPYKAISSVNKKQKPTALYTSLVIVAPKADSAVRNNAGNIEVKVELTPNLHASLKHQLQIYMDGKPLGEPSASTSFSFERLDRGTHILEVAVTDMHGKKMIQSAPVSFTLLRATVHQTKERRLPP